LTLRHIYSRIETIVVSSENPRVGEPNATFSSIVTYDQKRVSETTKVPFSTEEFSDYSINCFFVSKRSVKQVSTPDILDAAVRKICPPLTANGTTSVQSIYGRGEQYSGEGPGAGESYFITYPDIMANEQSIDLQAWRGSGYYGDYNPTNQTLALHFGLLEADADYSSRFFTPAAFAFIKANLTINNESKSYSYMRTNFFPRAPTFFLEQCRVLALIDGQQRPASCQGDKADFDVTLAQPDTIEDEIDSSQFTRNGKYSVKLNGSTYAQLGYQLLYAWNWDSPAFCLREALSLGFPLESLKA
jgi:hypothetical protein